MPTRTFVCLLVLPLTALTTPYAHGEDETPPTPRFDAIDYSRPDAHLALSPQVGDEEMISSLAAQLKCDTPQDTLASIFQWMHRNLRYDEKAAYRWRTLDEMLKDRTYGGCADHAAVFGTFARAAGIPTVWVKTMDVDWIEEFLGNPGGAKSWRGHVFLEVYIHRGWRLLDASAMRLYDGHDVKTRLYPGNRFAYDKGDDPFTLVLSCRWELWKKQTAAYFENLDRDLLPWSRSQDLLRSWRVYITGNSPIYRYAHGACDRLGYHVAKTFNTDFEVHLAQARGKTLIVTCAGRRPVLPESDWPKLLPPGWRGIVGGQPLPAEGFLAHDLADGTHVILITGQDSTAVQVEVARALSARRR